jgi:Zn-finger nucleic acid-binding protein
MRSYERNGVTVDQCTECRGIFLDRGELEHLVDAETSFHATPSPPAYGYPSERRDDSRRYAGDSHRSTKKRRSFLEDLFD